jgi:5-methylcytosine-specific restriction endonuclease McrA
LQSSQLRGRDSNPDFTVQSRANFHYSTPQREETRIATKPRGLSSRGEQRPRPQTRERVKELLSAGLTVGETARQLGITPSAVCYHARKLGIPPSAKYAPRGDWDEIQAHYDAGHSVRQSQARFGFSRRSWNKAVQRGAVIPRPQAMPLEDLLIDGRRTNRTHLKLRLASAGLKENRCEECGLDQWLGEALSMALHHVNGNGLDNRLENIRLLCPNCHSQTPNFARAASG